IKFTEKGYVLVNAFIQRKEDKTFYIQLDIADTGIGISSEYVEKIFDSFTQAGTDITRKYGGTGLGLTISKQLVSLMNGEISVKSEVGKGTTFTVIIPFAQSDMNHIKSETVVADEDSMRKLNN